MRTKKYIITLILYLNKKNNFIFGQTVSDSKQLFLPLNCILREYIHFASTHRCSLVFYWSTLPHKSVSTSYFKTYDVFFFTLSIDSKRVHFFNLVKVTRCIWRMFQRSKVSIGQNCLTESADNVIRRMFYVEFFTKKFPRSTYLFLHFLRFLWKVIQGTHHLLRSHVLYWKFETNTLLNF